MTTISKEADLADVAAELDAHYATYPREVSQEWRELDKISAAHPEWSSSSAVLPMNASWNSCAS